MLNPLVSRLEQFTRLSGDDKRTLDELVGERVRRFNAGEDIVREGEPPRVLNLILSGWAFRYKQFEDGRRQITAFLLPGDLCDYKIHALRAVDCTIGTITPVVLAELSPARVDEIARLNPRIEQGFWWQTLVNAAIQREWTANLGRRDAFERVAHLLCEIFYRLRSIGLAKDGTCELPITQAEMADATGITPVHVNRTLQELRARELIVLKGKRLVIPDLGALRAAALFTPGYLHLGHEGEQFDADAA